MNRFKILATVVLLLSCLFQGLKCASEESGKPLDLKTIVGLGSGGLGLYQLLSDREKRKKQIQKEIFNYEKAFYNDLMKTEVVGQGTDMLTANYQKLRHNFNVFSSSVHDQVNTIRHSVKQFIQNSNYKMNLMKAQKQAAEQSNKPTQDGQQQTDSQSTMPRKLKKGTTSELPEKENSQPLVISDALGRILPAPHYIRLNVQRIHRTPNNKLNLSISHPRLSRVVL